MKRIVQYLRNYLFASNKTVLLLTAFFCAMIIAVNFSLGLEKKIMASGSMSVKLFSWFAVFAISLNIPVFIHRIITGKKEPLQPTLIFLLILAPFLFACKYVLRFPISVTNDPVLNHTWNKIIYWPLLLLCMVIVLIILNHWLLRDKTFFGTRTVFKDRKTYITLLALMVPLVLMAGTQHDFQAMYPKLRILSADGQLHQLAWWKVLLFEFSYGSDFLNIELFFRGFLVLSLSRWLGRDAILPIAVFYCSIHFGKPLGECISSYFGGLILGVVVYNTRSIWGGLLVHLGIAWLMEVVGYLFSN